MSRVRIGGAANRRNVRLSRMHYAAADSSVFRCALNVVMVVELLVDQCNCCTSGLVTTWMGDCLQVNHLSM